MVIKSSLLGEILEELARLWMNVTIREEMMMVRIGPTLVGTQQAFLDKKMHNWVNSDLYLHHVIPAVLQVKLNTFSTFRSRIFFN